MRDQPPGEISRRLQTDARSGTIVIECPGCGGGQVYSPGPESGSSGVLRCRQCGADRRVEAGGPAPARPVAPAEAGRESAGGARLDEGLDRRLECPNCGAGVALTGTLAAATCPCCASAIQQADIRAAPGRAPIDGIVPLAVHPRQAQDLIEGWVRSRWLRPGSFYLRKSRGPLVTIYLPYLAVNAETETRYAGDRATDITYGKYGTAYYQWEPVTGAAKVSLVDVIARADGTSAEGRPKNFDEHSSWDVGGAVEFRPEFLAGALCRLPDGELAQCIEAAWPAVEEAVRDGVDRHVGGVNHRYGRLETSYADLTYRQLLLPVHATTITCQGKAHHVWVNGISGELLGDEPPGAPIRFGWPAIAGVTLLGLVIAVLLLIGVLADAGAP